MTVAAPSTNGTSRQALPPRPIQRPPSALELIRSAERGDTGTTAGPEPTQAPQAQAQPPVPGKLTPLQNDHSNQGA